VDHSGLTGFGALVRAGQSRSLGDAADEDRTRDPTRHATDDAPG
jgi:hypothetical protein